MKDRARSLAGLLAFGAIGGTLLDMLHTFSGTTEYTRPVFARTAWWVPFLFASAYGFGGALYALGYRRHGGRNAPPPWKNALVAVAVFAALYATSAYLPASNTAKLAALAFGAVALWVWLDRSWQGALLAAVTAFTGPFTEFMLWRAGLFRHLQPDAFGVPMWLPALYAASAPSFGQLARRALRSA